MSAIFKFPGIRGVISGSFSISHGIQPSVALLEVPLSTRLDTRVGTLRLEDRDNNFRQEWRDCRIQKVQKTSNETKIVTILDRRWKWKFGGTFLLANQRDDPDGGFGFAQLTKPHDIALFLLTQPPPLGLGEVNPSVDELPNDTLPEIRASGNPPAAELDALCQSLGCSIVLWDDRVSIRKAGHGMRLPDNPLRDGSTESNIPLVPDGVSAVSAPYRVEAMFDMQAVAEEPNGELVNVHAVSYAPPAGWFEEWPRYLEGVKGDENRRLALKSVFRYYRINQEIGAPPAQALNGADFGLFDRGQPVVVFKTEDLLPTLPHTNEFQEQPGNTFRARPAYLQGVFYDGNDDLQNRAGILKESFTYDPDRGLVIFNEPVYRLLELDDGNPTIEAILYLTVSVEIRVFGGQKLRHAVERVTGERNGTPFQVEQRFDVVPTVSGRYSAPLVGVPPTRIGVDNNLPDVEAELGRHTQVVINSLQAPEAQMQRWVGWWDNVQLDGAIRQIVYAFGPDGWSTTVSRNTEDPNFLAANLAEARRQTQIATAKRERPVVKQLMRELGKV